MGRAPPSGYPAHRTPTSGRLQEPPSRTSPRFPLKLRREAGRLGGGREAAVGSAGRDMVPARGRAGGAEGEGGRGEGAESQASLGVGGPGAGRTRTPGRRELLRLPESGSLV